MMMVDRFAVTIELMPLLQGEFRVLSMRLDRPHLRIAVGDDGKLDWQMRNEASKTLDPDKIVLERLEIADGHIEYSDRAAETELAFEGINAVAEARSLFGPWRIEGSYLEDGVAVPFRFATGRRLDDGTIRIRSDLSPAGWPVALAADGVLGSGEDGLFYDGTYNITEIVPAAASPDASETAQAGDAAGWRSEGKFRLMRRQLAITQAVLSEGPTERPYSIAGSLAVELGQKPRFEAHLSARQIDLDRSLGKGPTEPVEVGVATQSLVDWLVNSFVPPIPGSVFFNVPGIVVGGAVIQDVSFEARPTIGGWRLASFNASLPGRATLEARGVLATDFEVGFAGNVRLVVNQPAIFATWWRGKSQAGAGRRLGPFEFSGRAELSPRQFTFENIDASFGDAAMSGRFAWSDAATRQHRRVLETDLVADRIDFTQLRALAELVAGEDLANTSMLADSYDIKLAVEAFQFEDVTMRDVAIDAQLAEDALTVKEFGIGDLGGASINVTQGRIDSLSGKPQGHLDAQLDADTLDGLSRVVEQLFPTHAFAKWLRNAAPSLTPTFLTASVEAPGPADGTGFRLKLAGVAASTNLSASFDIAGGLARWREENAGVDIRVDTPDAAELTRQAGIATGAAGNAGVAQLQITADGTPASGLETRIAGKFGGVGLRSTGNLTLAEELPAAFTGTLAAAADDIEPLLRMTGVGIPLSAFGNTMRIDGKVALLGGSTELTLTNSQVADRLVNGRLSLAQSGSGSWQVGGDLHVDAVDLGWLTALGLGFALEPTGDEAAPWSRAPFGEVGYGRTSGRVAISADEFIVADGFDATGATLNLDLQPDRLSIDLAGSQVIGGALSGGLSVHNVGGNVSLTGRVDLKQATLESLIWSRAGRAVATGTLDLTAEFEAAGRSPSALVSSLTGGGTVAIAGGEARYVNSQAARLVIRASDLGQEFTENELRDAFAKQIDGGSLAFDRAESAFSLAAGVARIKGLAIVSQNTRATGSAEIDLAGMSIDSDWTVTFDPGDDRVESAAPQVGIVFRGPLDDPERSIDVLQFGSYLNIRQEERLLELLSEAEADRLEIERLNREKRKLREDADRRARKASEAEAIRIAAETERERRAAEAVARRDAEDEAARDAAEADAARIAAELEQRRLVAEAAARVAGDAQSAHAAVAEDAARLAADAERQALVAEKAAAAADSAESARIAGEEAMGRARETEAARRTAEEIAARVAADAAQRSASAEEAAVKAADVVAAQATAAEEAASSAADAERQLADTEQAARAAADEVSARQVAEAEAAGIATDAERQHADAVAAARSADGEAGRRREHAQQAAGLATQAEERRFAAEEAARIAADALTERDRAEAEAVMAPDGVEPTEGLAEARRLTVAAEEAAQKAEQALLIRKAEEDDARRLAAEAERSWRDAADEAARLTVEADRMKIVAEAAAGKAGEAAAARQLAEEQARALAAAAEQKRASVEEATGKRTQLAAERETAEAEAARLTAEAERLKRVAEVAAREAAVAETARIAAEEEANRLAAETEGQKRAADEAARVAAEEEATRIAVGAEAARRAADARRQALAAEEASRKAAEAETALNAFEEESARGMAETARRHAVYQARRDNLAAARGIAIGAALAAADAARQDNPFVMLNESQSDGAGASLAETDTPPEPAPIPPPKPLVLSPQFSQPGEPMVITPQ